MEREARRIIRRQASGRVGARGNMARKIADGKCVMAIVGRRPRRLEIGEARREEIALAINGIANNEDRREMGVSNRV